MDLETKFFFEVLEGNKSFGDFDEVPEQIEAIIIEAVIDTLNEKYEIDITVKDLDDFSEVYKRNLNKRLEKYFS